MRRLCPAALLDLTASESASSAASPELYLAGSGRFIRAANLNPRLRGYFGLGIATGHDSGRMNAYMLVCVLLYGKCGQPSRVMS